MELNYFYEAVPMLDRYLESKEAAWPLPGIAREPAYRVQHPDRRCGPVHAQAGEGAGSDGKQADERGDYETRIFQSRIHHEQ